MKLDAQKAAMHSATGTSANGEHASSSGRSQHHDPNAPALARTELVRRIEEEDRERHKRRWVQPTHPASTLGSTVLVTQLASLAPGPDTFASTGTTLPAPGPGIGGAAAPPFPCCTASSFNAVPTAAGVTVRWFQPPQLVHSRLSTPPLPPSPAHRHPLQNHWTQ